MSIIEEEPCHMRESRLDELEKHPDHIMPSNDGFEQAMENLSLQSRTKSSPNAVDSRPPSASLSYTSAKKKMNMPADNDKEPNARDSRAVSVPHRSSRLDFRHDVSEKRHSRHYASPSRQDQLSRNEEHYSNDMSMNQEDATHTRTWTPSSSEEDEHNRKHRSLQNRLKKSPKNTHAIATSIPLPSSKQKLVPRQTAKSPLRSLDRKLRKNKLIKIDSMHSSNSRNDNQSLGSRPSSKRDSVMLIKTRAKSSPMLPPFREPYAERQLVLSNAPQSNTTNLVRERMPRKTPRYNSPSRTSNSHKPKAFPPQSSQPCLTDIDMYEDLRAQEIKEATSSRRKRLESKPRARLPTYTDDSRQVSSCRESKTYVIVSPKKLNSANAAEAQQFVSRNPFLSSHRTRSSSLIPNKSPKSFPKNTTVPRSASASNLSSHGSMPSSPRPSTPHTPLRLRHYEGRFSNRRLQTLFYFSLFPAEKAPLRGIVLCLHGIGDHCRRNVNLYERLCREGFGVITYDLLNHGVSDLDQHKTRAHIGNFRHLVDDTNDFITFAKRFIYVDALRYWRTHYCVDNQKTSSEQTLQPELPLIIAGTSFGSLIGIHTILAGEHTFHAAVWGSPTIGVTWTPLLWAESKLSKPLAAILPTAKVVPAVQHDRLCRDPKFLRRFKADPLTSMDMITTRTGYESLQAMALLQDDKRVTDPGSAFCAVSTIFLAGSADGISDQQAALKFFGLMGNFDKEFKLFDGLFHLVYEEPEKEDVFRYLARWLHRRFPVATQVSDM
ncbi:hypothetical protein CCR75_003517 [Bremia lactucae]|uniref:Serine aminopeptidase S33 domain-containing protein n=1 Tax=Bremia lactucae TaxID=4779 RepID=A0A976IHB4_BRELC|nr:hypothetical protein CCR75_003517 [Bremia lactucae]